MKKSLYHIVFSLWWMLSLLPLRMLYCISDGMFYLIYYVVRYRRHLVRKNLTVSFPQKSTDEIIKIEKDFYSWFCDYIVEAIKLMTMSESEMRRRMRFEGVELINHYVREGRACGVYLGHYCNWELVTSLPLWVDEKAECCQIYHVLENETFNKLFLYLRSRFGAVSVPMAETLRYIVKQRKQGKALVMGFIADQTPFWNNIHYWTHFLNHEKTAVFTGAERIIKQADFAAFYMDLRLEKRGHYVATFKLITENPQEESEFAITEKATRLLETSICRQPHLWLWTHDRWKRTYERWLEKMGNGKQ